jgi:hypothetical protein
MDWTTAQSREWGSKLLSWLFRERLGSIYSKFD